MADRLKSGLNHRDSLNRNPAVKPGTEREDLLNFEVTKKREFHLFVTNLSQERHIYGLLVNCETTNYFTN